MPVTAVPNPGANENPTMPSPADNLHDWRALYPFKSNWLTLDGGVRMHYLDEGGAGEPVVMVHGNPTWSFYYRNLACGLRGGRRIIVPDHIGCGLSDKPQDYPYRVARHIENLERLLIHELKLERFSLVVHDWGGAIGCGVAVRHPERVTKLVVLNTAAFLSPDCPKRIRILRTPGLGALAVRGFNAFAGGAVRMAAAHRERMTPQVKAGYLAPYGNWRDRVATLRFVEDIPLSPRHPSWRTMSDIEEKLPLLRDKPMLICWGGRDFCFHDGFLKGWTEHFPAAFVHRFADAGHYVLEDAGERILPLVQEFLGQP